jgi:type IV secretion system protein TrbL
VELESDQRPGRYRKELTPGGYSSESPFLTGMQLVKLVLDKLSIWSPGNSVPSCWPPW